MRPPKIIVLLSSWWLTTALILSLIATYVSFSFGRNPYPEWTAFMFHAPLGLVLYVVLIVNFAAASVRIVYTRLKRREVSPEIIRKMDSYAEITAPDGNGLQAITAWMKKEGFPGTISASGTHIVKDRYSFLPGTILRAGIILLMTALLFSLHLRKSMEMTFHEGELKTISGADSTLNSIHANLPDDFLQVGEDGSFVLDRVSSVLESSGTAHTITSLFPTRINGRYCRIVHLGYAQQLTAKTSGKTLDKTVDLDILPPGKIDIVPLPSGDTFLTFTLQPERTITKGLLTGKQYNLQKLFYRVIVQEGKKKNKPVELLIRPGERKAAGGLDISLGNHAPFIKIQAVYDPALRWIYFGIMMGLAGLTLMLSRFFWYERRLSAILVGNAVHIGYSEEYYRKWGILKFQRWKEELSALDLL